MAKILVNGSNCPCPSLFKWGIHDISAPDAGRTEDTIMHKNMIGQKEEIQLQWNFPKPDVTAKILQMFNQEYFNVTYLSPLTNSMQTKVFYRGDPNASVYTWTNGGLYESIGFSIIER